VKTDAAAFATPPQLLRASAAPAWGVSAAGLPPLNSSDLAAIIVGAKQRWAASGLGASALSRLDSVTAQVADLDGLTLGQEVGDTIVVDPTAAGYGWFIDATPLDDSEFVVNPSSDMRRAIDAPPASGRMDLLTVVMHELGHVLGLGDLEVSEFPDDLMTEVLEPGTRQLPDEIVIPADPAKPSGALRAGRQAEVPLTSPTSSSMTPSDPRSASVNLVAPSVSAFPDHTRQHGSGRGGRGANAHHTGAPGGGRSIRISVPPHRPEVLDATLLSLFERNSVDTSIPGHWGRGKRGR